MSLLFVCLPICSTNLPSAENLRIWPSFSPLPVIHTKPLASACAPRSLPGQS